MATAGNRYVVKRDDGGWDVVKDGHRRASVHVTDRATAITRAKALTRRAGGGEVVVLGRSGKIAESKLVPRPAPRRRAA
jgi:Uncharacterized protein conserved in bacteria (DUF2188)